MVQAQSEIVLFLTMSALPSAKFTLLVLFLFAVINTYPIVKDMPFFSKM